MGIFDQFSGNGLSYFNLSIYEAAGYDSNVQLILNLINNVLSALGALTGVALSDRMRSRHRLFPIRLLPRYQRRSLQGLGRQREEGHRQPGRRSWCCRCVPLLWYHLLIFL